MDAIDGNTEALNSYMRKQQSGEEQHQEVIELIECRLDEAVEEMADLIREINGLDYGIDGKELVIEHLTQVL